MFSFPPVVLGYHGCDRSVGLRLLSGEIKFDARGNSDDWLGYGIYFWENAPFRALKWARSAASGGKGSRGKITKPFVVGAIIDLRHCLNLLDTENIEIIRESYRYVADLHKRSHRELPENQGFRHFLDCEVLNRVHEVNADYKLPAFDSVRGAFIEGKRLYKGAFLYDETHIQICVRNPLCIRGLFLPIDLPGLK